MSTYHQTVVNIIVTSNYVLNDNKTIQYVVKNISVFEATYTGFTWKSLILQSSQRIEFSVVWLLNSW